MDIEGIAVLQEGEKFYDIIIVYDRVKNKKAEEVAWQFKIDKP